MNQENDRWFEQLLIEHCAPTLRGLKMANLFRCHPESRETILQEVAQWQQQLENRGISLRIVKECQRTGDYLVYLYRERELAAHLREAEVCSFLRQAGYVTTGDREAFLAQLSSRLCMEREFPHEIGIFLGYPLCDVVGFIENGGKNYTCSGYWKAYGDPVEANRRFSSYRKCMEYCRSLFEKGIPVIQLVAAA